MSHFWSRLWPLQQWRRTPTLQICQPVLLCKITNIRSNLATRRTRFSPVTQIEPIERVGPCHAILLFDNIPDRACCYLPLHPHQESYWFENRSWRSPLELTLSTKIPKPDQMSYINRLTFVYGWFLLVFNLLAFLVGVAVNWLRVISCLSNWLKHTSTNLRAILTLRNIWYYSHFSGRKELCLPCHDFSFFLHSPRKTNTG